jgi:hypothetical protein
MPVIEIWDTYATKEACESDRSSLENDQVVGERMKAGA